MTSFLRATIVLCSLVVATLSASNANAAEGEPDWITASEKKPDIDGARFYLGAFAFAHARRTTGFDSASPMIVPGFSLGCGWRLGGWEIDAGARGAYRDDKEYSRNRETMFLAASGRLRGFTHPRSSISPYFGGGLDLAVLTVDYETGAGLLANFAAGVEFRHVQMHHRLRIEVGIDVPSFVLRRETSRTYDDWAPGSAGTTSTGERPLYVVPVTLAANWTF